jgi:hypothetical protein
MEGAVLERVWDSEATKRAILGESGGQRNQAPSQPVQECSVRDQGLENAVPDQSQLEERSVIIIAFFIHRVCSHPIQEDAR